MSRIVAVVSSKVVTPSLSCADPGEADGPGRCMVTARRPQAEMRVTLLMSRLLSPSGSCVPFTGPAPPVRTAWFRGASPGAAARRVPGKPADSGVRHGTRRRSPAAVLIVWSPLARPRPSRGTDPTGRVAAPQRNSPSLTTVPFAPPFRHRAVTSQHTTAHARIPDRRA